MRKPRRSKRSGPPIATAISRCSMRPRTSGPRCLRSMPSTPRSHRCATASTSRCRARSGCNGGAMPSPGARAAGHPLAEALLAAISRHDLPKKPFDDYLEARIFDLYDDPMPGRAELEGYCGETASALIQLAAMILDPEAAPSVAEAAGHAGCAQAITGLIRLLPLHRARGQCYVPGDILAAAGTSAAVSSTARIRLPRGARWRRWWRWRPSISRRSRAGRCDSAVAAAGVSAACADGCVSREDRKAEV